MAPAGRLAFVQMNIMHYRSKHSQTHTFPSSFMAKLCIYLPQNKVYHVYLFVCIPCLYT